MAEGMEQSSDGCYVALTHDHLDVQSIMARVRSPEAGATVIFAGTTRDNFDGKKVTGLNYSAYNPMALRTLLEIAKNLKEKHSLKGIAIIHRLGDVPIGEEGILIAVSSPHRTAAWRAGEEALELAKEKVEVWKYEKFEGDEGVWKANRDGAKGQRLEPSTAADELLAKPPDVQDDSIRGIPGTVDV